MVRHDPALVIGGGFYGCSIAELLARRGMEVVLVEREPLLLARASYSNQARLHGGYHYPRSFGTGYRSRLNFGRFMADFGPAIGTGFTKLYAIVREHSKVSPRQFETFCSHIEAPIRPARAEYRELFARRLVAAVYEVEEFCFDAGILRRLLRERLEAVGVQLRLGRRVSALSGGSGAALEAQLDDGERLRVGRVFNCTYSGLNTVDGVFRTRHRLKHEITEMALIELPEPLAGLSVTVMDGPFFSFMPFPDRGLNTFSHVRYTPRANWIEECDGVLDPYATLEAYPRDSAFPFMLRDAARYLPALVAAERRDSLFEVKTVLMKNEGDDGRPILFEWDLRDPRIVSVLGSKIDNIYDALEAVETHLHAFA